MIGGKKCVSQDGSRQQIFVNGERLPNLDVVKWLHQVVHTDVTENSLHLKQKGANNARSFLHNEPGGIL